MFNFNIKNFLLTFLCFILFQNQLYAVSCNGDKGTTIIFVNGIQTDRANAYKYLIRIIGFELNDKFTGSGNNTDIVYYISHNQDEGFFLDLYESAKQQLGLDLGSTFKEFFNFQIITEDQRNSLNQIYIDTFVDHLLSQKDISDLINKMNSSLANDRRTFLIGHSQGNLFINLAHSVVMANPENLSKISTLGIIEVAPPTQTIGGPLINGTIG